MQRATSKIVRTQQKQNTLFQHIHIQYIYIHTTCGNVDTQSHEHVKPGRTTANTTSTLIPASTPHRKPHHSRVHKPDTIITQSSRALHE